MRHLKILVVDDEKSVCDVLEDALAKHGHLVETQPSGELALETARKRSFDVVFLDIKMPGLNGVETLKQMRQLLPEAEFIMITSDLVDESLSSGAFICLSKPFGLNQVTDVIKDLARQRSIEQKLRSREPSPA
jgi:DNA-binding NtrC family response regulator